MNERLRLPAAAVCLLVVAALAVAAPSRAVPPDRRMNIVLILSDDQTFESIPHDPPVMPKLQSLLEDPHQHWIRFPNAFINTPLCCPSRSSILTGEYSHHTGVVNNNTGQNLDVADTIATALHAGGYTTGLIGKYLNEYPFGNSPVVPPGWDTWLAKLQGPQHSVYRKYALTNDGFPVAYGNAPQDYSTDVYANAAASFIRTAPTDHPFFLMFTPMVPHSPWIPAARDEHSWTAPIRETPSFNERDVSDKPAWVRALPLLTPDQTRQLHEDHRRNYETLGALDDAVLEILDALQARRALDDTLVVFLTDNGFSFGEHRWVTKSCPYDECIRTPFFVRFPGASAHTDPHPVSNVDLAPTFADIARVSLAGAVDGRSLLPLLLGRSPPGWPPGVLSEFAGGRDITGWWEMRTPRFAYVEYVTGERELYDLQGTRGPADPFELRNVAGTPRYADAEARLSQDLRAARRA
ncbi:MAG: sulfatase family protein [Actinomycetota bacterium]